MNKRTFCLSFGMIFIIGFICVVSASSKEINYSLPNIGNKNAQFVVQTLKYEPYPVNAGDYFDLWVKIQNVGQSDATNAQFQLINAYPFSSDDSIKEFGIIPGTISAYQYKQPSDASIEINQVLMKFRVKVDDSAPEGENILKIQGVPNNATGSGAVFNIPIFIEKTKTKFSVSLQNKNLLGMSFVVTNIGDTRAKAVNLNVEDGEGVTYLAGNEPSSLGDLDKGDFTVAHQNVAVDKNVQNLTLLISYTDTAGIRSTFEKTISLDTLASNYCPTPSDTITQWTYGVVGFLVGMFIILLIVVLRQKKSR